MNLAKYTWDTANGWHLTYHLNDHLGSRQVICNTGGSITSNSDYKTFGKHESGTIEEAAFTGKKFDEQTALYYFNARRYDPLIGRFTTLDPKCIGMCWYVYCENNPLKFVDKTGLAPSYAIKTTQANSAIAWGKVGSFLLGSAKTIGGIVSGAAAAASYFGAGTLGLVVGTVDEGAVAFALAAVGTAAAVASGKCFESAGKDFSKAFESSGKSDGGGKKANINSKINKQMGKRGWTEKSIYDTIDDPYQTSDAINKTTGNDATAYFNKDGSYVVVDNVTNDVIQVSDTTRPWAPDSTITNPYIP